MADPDCKLCGGKGSISDGYAIERCACNYPSAESIRDLFASYSADNEFISEKNDRLKQALKDIIKHQEIVAGKTSAKLTGAWCIAQKALGNKDFK